MKYPLTELQQKSIAVCLMLCVVGGTKLAVTGDMDLSKWITTITSAATLLTIAGPYLKHWAQQREFMRLLQDLYIRLIPPRDPHTGERPPCIVERVKFVEKELDDIRRIVDPRLKNPPLHPGDPLVNE